MQKAKGTVDNTGYTDYVGGGYMCHDSVTGFDLYCPVRADLNPVTSGDVLVVGIVGGDPEDSNVNSPTPVRPVVSDTLHSTFSRVTQYDDLALSAATVGQHVAIFVATLSASGSDTVTYSEAEGSAQFFTDMAQPGVAFVFEVSGVTTAAAQGAVGKSGEIIPAGPVSIGTGSSVYFNSGAFLFGIAYGEGSTANPVLTVGSGFTQFSIPTQYSYGVEYSTSGAPSPSFFPETADCGVVLSGCVLTDYFDVGIALEPTSLATLSLSSVSVVRGGGLTLETDFTSVPGCLPNCAYLLFVGVITPSGDTYVCPGGNYPSRPCDAAFTAGGDTGGCAMPFGVAGSLTPTGSGISGCSSGVAALVPPWYLVADPSLSSLESDCTQQSQVPGNYSSTVIGSTSEVGTYQVMSCWVSQGVGFFATTPFSVAPVSSSVPQFPIASLTSVLLIALLLPALLYESRKSRVSAH